MEKGFLEAYSGVWAIKYFNTNNKIQVIKLLTAVILYLMSSFVFMQSLKAQPLKMHPCTSLIFEKNNKNISIPIATYLGSTMAIDRDLFDYISDLAQLEESVGQMSENDFFLDSGSGLGLAGINVVRESTKKLNVISISSQPFLTYIRDHIKNVLAMPTFSFSTTLSRYIMWRPTQYKIIKNLEDVEMGENLLNLTDSLGIRSPQKATESNISEQEVRQHLTIVLSSLNKLLKNKHFTYRVGFVEKILKTLTNRITVVADNRGPYMYSGNRVSQLMNYYNVLKPGGRAHIFIGFESHQNVDSKDHISFVKQGQQTLEAFLSECYPEIFSIEISNRGYYTLIISKSKSRPRPLNLEAVLRLEKSLWREFETGVEVPVETYGIITPKK